MPFFHNLMMDSNHLTEISYLNYLGQWFLTFPTPGTSIPNGIGVTSSEQPFKVGAC